MFFMGYLNKQLRLLQEFNMKIKGSKLDRYWKYIALSKEERKKRINHAEQDKYSRPNPQGNHVFPFKNFVEFDVLDEDGLIVRLATFRYPAKSQPKAVVIMFHGLNSHIGHGAHIAYQLSEHEIETVGFDHRGFGESQGEPGYVKNLQYHIDDCLKFVAKIKNLYPGLPLFCLGLSMGGLASYYLSLTHPDMFQGAILMAPALKNQIGGFLVGLSTCLKSLLPEHTKLTGPVYGKASRNPAITDFVKEDPYAYKGRVNLSTAAFLTTTMDRSPDTFKNYRCPFLIVQGGLDKLVNPMGAFELFQLSPLPEEDKDIIFYEGMWHDIWHQPEIMEINKEIVKWLQKRLKANEKIEKNMAEQGEKNRAESTIFEE